MILLFMQIGEYDSDDGELWDDDDDDDLDSERSLADSQGSWETESEHSVNDTVHRTETFEISDNLESGGAGLRSRLAASIERSRIAMTKLENVFSEPTNPAHRCSNNCWMFTKIVEI